MNQKMLPVIKWSGSKRSQAGTIASLFPEFKTYFEPFLGGGSVLIQSRPKHAICGDVCEPLIEFWNMIKDNPMKMIKGYAKSWQVLQDKGYTTYYKIRDRFNANPNPSDLLFLSRTCVNGLIRFNSDGKFNNSLHHTRKGINPKTLENIVLQWSECIQNYKFITGNYFETTKSATKNDFVYLDPPYFNTVGRYYGKIVFDDFIDYLEELGSRNIKYAFSYDGFRDKIDYTVDIPKHVYKRRIFLDSGNSSFKKVIDKQSQSVKESFYMNF